MLSMPFLAIKGVSDFVYHDQEDLSQEFANNLGPVSEEVATVVQQCIDYMMGKNPNSL
jgi:hypothetical protein